MRDGSFLLPGTVCGDCLRAVHRRPSDFSGEGQLLLLACLLGEGVIHQTVEVHPFLLLQLSGGGHHRL